MLATDVICETECTSKFQDKEFTSGGAYLLPCIDGKWRGAIYVNEKNMTVTTWHGELIAQLDTMTRYHGNFCTMRRISFTWHDMKFVGDYCPDWSELCKVRTTKAHNV